MTLSQTVIIVSNFQRKGKSERSVEQGSHRHDRDFMERKSVLAADHHFPTH